jgi:hypothetical protein
MRGPRGGYRETYRTISSGAALGTTLLMRMSCKDMTRNTLNQRQKMAQRERKSMESLMFSKAGLQPRPCDLMLLKISPTKERSCQWSKSAGDGENASSVPGGACIPRRAGFTTRRNCLRRLDVLVHDRRLPETNGANEAAMGAEIARRWARQKI